MNQLNYPEHKHPHGVENKPENPERIWVCTECNCQPFLDTELRNAPSDDGFNGWGHVCKSHPRRKNDRCESHLEPYVPDV